jgi:hypothetical protein
MPDLAIYEKYERMLHKIAWDYAGSNYSKKEELFSEAVHAFWAKAYPVVKEQEKNCTSFVYTVVKNAVLDYLYSHDDPTDAFIEIQHSVTPYHSLKVKEAINELSDDSKYIVSIFLEGEVHKIGVDFHAREKATSPREIRGSLIKSLIEDGWKESAIYSAFTEIKTMVAAL